jgi:cephalosporin hydroxylase
MAEVRNLAPDGPPESQRDADGRTIPFDPVFSAVSKAWFAQSVPQRYSYRFSWLGRPIIQYPQDMLAVQELIWRVKPDLIVETGVAHGGSLIFNASILELLGGTGRVIGIEVAMRPNNRSALEQHAMFKRITLLEGSSIDDAIIAQVAAAVQSSARVMVILDSHHTEAHVLSELLTYSDFVSKGSYIVVMDTAIEDLPDDSFPQRPWGRGNNPMTAVREFLRRNDRFVVDHELVNKLSITGTPEGYLLCVKDAGV